MNSCDVLVVGAGFAGMVMAERLSNELGKKCIVVERRNHLGGNAYDCKDEHGVLIHKYGPHIFHTNSERIFEYLSKFTKWLHVDFSVKSFTGGRYWSFPISLDTFEEILGRPSSSGEMEAYLADHKVDIAHPRNFEEQIVSKVGWELYEKFYKGYTTKQWNLDPKILDASVGARIPIRTTHNNSYFDDKFQCLPLNGYTNMFSNMLNPNIEVVLNTDYRDLKVSYKHLVYTGPVDEYFNYEHGTLPYRSLRFENDTFKENLHQPACTVVYPNDHRYTRTVEMKHITKQECSYTTVVREYPEDYKVGMEAFYPMPTADAAAAYAKYKEHASTLANVTFVGRLATYRYYNMDQVVGSALAEFERLRRFRWTSVN